MLGLLMILYKPELNAITTIDNALSVGLAPVVYLNEADDDFVDKLQLKKIKILGCNQNHGLGHAFYKANEYFEDNCILHYVYFDQDTIVEKKAFEYISCTYLTAFQEKKIGMLHYGYSKKTFPIALSSGCVFSTKISRIIGGHNKLFFVEGVDYDYCLSLIIFNYEIKFINCKDIDHYSLQNNIYYEKFGKKFQLRVYGNKRIKDFNRSHYKLIFKALRHFKPKLLIFFIYSYLIFNTRELVSRFLAGRV